MQNLKLVKPAMEHKRQYEKMMDAWEAFGGRMNPGALRRNGASYEKWLSWMEDDRHAGTCPRGSVPQDLYFLINDQDRILGAASIRHYLTPPFLNNGGNIGYGIRPSEREKGYGKAQLTLAMDKCRKEFGFDRLLITCDKTNPTSAAVIRANGGVLESEFVEEGGNVVLRFWID